MKKHGLIALLSIFTILPILFAQIPTDIESTPVMPNAKYSKNYTQIVNNKGGGALSVELFGLSLRDSKRKGFISNSSYDEIVAFYKAKLGAENSDYVHTEKDFVKVKNNNTAFIQYEDLGYHIIFSWIYKVSEKEVHKFFVYTNKEMEYTYEGGSSVFYFIQNKYAADASSAFPTSSKLGAPIYPNAKFSPEHSVEGGRVITYAYVTTDRLEDVIKFYEAKFNKKADTEDNIFYGFAGFNSEYPDDGIFMSRNANGGVAIVYQLVPR